MTKEDSKRALKLMAAMAVVNIISCFLLWRTSIYGLNVLITALPYGWLLCEFLDEKPRQGMLLTVVLVSCLAALPFSLRMAGVLLLAGFCGEFAYMYAKRKKPDQECKVSLITTFNTMIYPLLILWELLASQGEADFMMKDFTTALILFVLIHLLGFAGVRLSLKDKAEFH